MCFEEVKYICYVANIFFIHFWILFVKGLEQRPGVNLQIIISAKVDNSMTKIAEYSLIDQTFANFLLFCNMTTNHKTVQLSFTMWTPRA